MAEFLYVSTVVRRELCTYIYSMLYCEWRQKKADVHKILHLSKSDLLLPSDADFRASSKVLGRTTNS